MLKRGSKSRNSQRKISEINIFEPPSFTWVKNLCRPGNEFLKTFAGTFVASGLLRKQNNWIEVSLPEDYWLLPKRFSSMHLHGFCWCDRKLLFITSLDHFQIYIFPNNLWFYDKHLCWQIPVKNMVKLYQKSVDFHKLS